MALPRKFDNAAAAIIGVFRCRRTMTVIAAIASAMKQARATPRTSEPARAPPTMMTTPTSATALASMVRRWGISLSHIQASPAARKGPVAMMIATLETSVSCSAGMKAIIASVENDATSQPLMSILTRSRKLTRPCNSTIKTMIMPPANNPRQNRMVQEVVGKQPCEERRGAPGNGGGDDEGDAEAMLGARLRHLLLTLKRG